MNEWTYALIPEAQNDFDRLDGSQKLKIRKAIQKLTENPLPKERGGYGEPLGSKRGANLSGFLKLKLSGEGLRIVYRLQEKQERSLVIVIGVRADEEVYGIAQKRILKNSFET